VTLKFILTTCQPGVVLGHPRKGIGSYIDGDLLGFDNLFQEIRVVVIFFMIIITLYFRVYLMGEKKKMKEEKP